MSTPDDIHPAEAALWHLLFIVDSYAKVLDVSGDTGHGHGYIEGKRPTHAVIDEEGDTIGRGMSEISAITNAIEEAHRRERSTRRRFEERWTKASEAMRDLVGVL